MKKGGMEANKQSHGKYEPCVKVEEVGSAERVLYSANAEPVNQSTRRRRISARHKLNIEPEGSSATWSASTGGGVAPASSTSPPSSRSLAADREFTLKKHETLRGIGKDRSSAPERVFQMRT